MIYKELGAVCIFYKGQNINYKDIEKRPGHYPIYSAQTLNNGEIGKWDKYDFDGEYVTWTTRGYAGHVFFRSGQFSVTNNCGIFQSKDNKRYYLKYIYYFLSKVLKRYVNPGSAIPLITNSVVKKIKIPFPPIEEQIKIANTLDHFVNIQNELKSELQDRSQQYLHYRFELLSEAYFLKLFKFQEIPERERERERERE